jgi:acyl carrier protein
MEKIREEIKRYIINDLTTRKEHIENDEPLFTSGIIDSLGHVKLLYFIEKNIGVAVKMEEITIENFDTVQKIAEFIVKKRGD